MRKIISIVSVLLLSVFIISACSNDGDGIVKENYLYYLNESKDSLVKVDYHIDAEETELIIIELLKNMDKDSEEGKYFSAKPNSIEIPEFQIVDKTITLYFGNEYSEIKSPNEVLYRAALVLTLTQVSGVEYVNIYVGEQPLLDSSGLPLSNMTSKSFVDLSGKLSDLDQDVTLLMYYPNEDGDMLIEETFEGKIDGGKSLEEAVVGKLRGKVFSENVEVFSVVTRNSVCYVDFSKEFDLEHMSIDDDVAIYSIVNSLCELSNVSKVKISIDGDSDLKYHENISLNQNFTRNLDVVQQ